MTMSVLRDVTADLLEREGALVAPAGPEGLEVLAPPELQQALGLPEVSQLAFGAERPAGATRVGLEGDWLERLEGLVGPRGHYAERMLSYEAPPPGDPETVLDKALALPNAVWRLRGVSPAWTRYRVFGLRYSALADEKREGVLRLGVNLFTGAPLDEILTGLWPRLAEEADWREPDAAVLAAAPPGWDPARQDAWLRRAVPPRLGLALAPFLRSQRRRLARDQARLHQYHEELYRETWRRQGDARDDGERQRQALRMEAIEREYRSKLDDLRHNYALRLTVEGVQTLDLLLPVQRFDVLIKRRKGERVVSIDWNPALRRLEPLLCEAGPGLGLPRLVCDDALHVTDPAEQGPCPACGKPYCRACHPASCPKCGHRSPETDGKTLLSEEIGKIV